MKIEYDPNADALYIRICSPEVMTWAWEETVKAEGLRIVSKNDKLYAKKLEDNMRIDINKNQAILGIEIMNASNLYPQPFLDAHTFLD